MNPSGGSSSDSTSAMRSSWSRPRSYRTLTCPLIRSNKGRSGWSLQVAPISMKVKLT